MRWVYFFGNGRADGRGNMKDLLGGKGAGLAEMTNLGVPVPPGFTVTTAVCNHYYAHGKKLPADFPKQFREGLSKLEHAMAKRLGDPVDPLLVSVRSGAKFSMPGMMDTILNLGLTDVTVAGLAKRSGNDRFAWDAYRRFIQMFGNVVSGIPKEKFEHALDAAKSKRGTKSDTDLTAADLRGTVTAFKVIYRQSAGEEFPQDPLVQLARARDAVFTSWNNPRAIEYRRINKIADSLGTAVNVQAMVFGNMGNDSATGVGFTRNPSSGEKTFYGEYLTNAQGEDVVAGIRTPRPIAELEQEMPAAYAQLRRITAKLEKHYRDVQDFEFTIEKDRLFMLQTRTGKRTGVAAVRIAVDMVKEKLITKKQALLRVEPEALSQLLAPVFDREAKQRSKVLAKGLNAGPGAASGRIMFSAEKAHEEAKRGPVLLVRPETNPDDIKGMYAAEGILTAVGGLTSHAAVVARGAGKPCVVGCHALEINEHAGVMRVNGAEFKEGDDLSIDGFTGEVLAGRLPTRPSEIVQVLNGELAASESVFYRYFSTFMSWADEAREIGVRTNADRPEDARLARRLGAEGIGLCRTEHMFFGERVGAVVRMILASTEPERRKALEVLYPFQKDDFKGILREMKGYGVTIRTLDPPLHEFLPKTREEAEARARELGVSADLIWARAQELHEFNPMLGHRGCRLGITYPEITEMQARAIIAAACELAQEGVKVVPEIMIPLVGTIGELRHQKAVVVKAALRTMAEYGVKVTYMVGTMIEVPRAALIAADLAKEAEFFSFGTNDLTQMTLGFSRDDSGRFIKAYLEKAVGILKDDPFATLDTEGVGRLMRLAVQEGRKGRKGLKCGICGEHGGDPNSVKFCAAVGLDYVSASPYRVPIARLAAAQAALGPSEYSSK